MNRSDLFFSQQNMNLLCRDESCSVYQMKNETGDGTATYYEVYPGIGVIYNDFHMASCPPRRFDNTHYISIHHCREGRIEWEVSNGAYGACIIFRFATRPLAYTAGRLKQ